MGDGGGVKHYKKNTFDLPCLPSVGWRTTGRGWMAIFFHLECDPLIDLVTEIIPS